MAAKSLGAKAISLGVMILISTMLIAYIILNYQSRQQLSQALSNTQRITDLAKRSVKYDMLHFNPDRIQQIISDIGQQEGIEKINILDKKGRVVYSSKLGEINSIVDKKAQACNVCHSFDLPEVVLKTSKRYRIINRATGGQSLELIDPIYNEPACYNANCHAHPAGQRVLGVLDILYSFSEISQGLAASKRNIMLLAGFYTAAMLTFALLFMRKLVTRPVQLLLTGMDRVARGDLSHSIPVESHDEMGVLASSFNKMMHDLRGAKEELEKWAHTLEIKVKEKTEELREAQAHMVQTEKLASLGKIAAGVAHELNSPLTGVLTFAHLLLKQYPEGSPENEDIKIIIQETTRCATIVRALLDFAREGPPKKEICDVHYLIDHTLALIEHQSIFHNISILKELQPSMPKIMVDPNQITQVFMNIILNAAEAMSNSGTLTIRTRMMPGQSGSPESIEVEFRDTGKGIEPEHMERIFDPFFTTKEAGKGTGLGLSVSYGIVERHGGSISAQSQPGKGAKFIIRLPMQVKAAKVAPDAGG